MLTVSASLWLYCLLIVVIAVGLWVRCVASPSYLENMCIVDGSSPGIVDIPYVVLEPTHNKQDFADAKVRLIP